MKSMIESLTKLSAHDQTSRIITKEYARELAWAILAVSMSPTWLLRGGSEEATPKAIRLRDRLADSIYFAYLRGKVHAFLPITEEQS